MQLDPSNEPRWVTKIFRLFPHPLFAACVGLACLAVAAIFTLGTIFNGPRSLSIVAIAFGASAYWIFAAIIIRRRNRRLNAQHPRPNDGLDRRDADKVIGRENDLSGLPPVPTSHLLLYLATIIVWEAKIGTFLIGALGGVQLPDMWRYSLTLIYVLLTLFALRLGWQDIQRLRMSGGKVELTRAQTALVIGIAVSCGVTGVVIFEMFRSNL